MPVTQRLGEHYQIPRRGRRVGQHRRRRHQPGHRQAVQRLRGAHRVAADQRATRGAHRVRAAAQNLAHHRFRHLVRRVGEEIERSERPAAHGVHVGQRVHRRDPAVGIAVIDDRREEIHGLYERALGIQPKHAGIVAGSRIGQHVRVFARR